MFRGMLAGFVLLTYSVVSGTFFAESVFGKPLTFTHKTMFGILSWLIYGGLLLKHSMYRMARQESGGLDDNRLRQPAAGLCGQ